MTDKETIRADKSALVAVLQDAGAVFRGNACKCVFHQDTHPSAGIYLKDGVWRFKCQACGEGGDIFDIQAKLNKTTVGDELKAVGRSKPQGQATPKRDALAFASLDAVRAYLTAKVGPIESEHPYPSADGDVVQIVFRCRTAEGKTFRPVHLTDKGYILSAAAKPWVLYGLPAVVNAETVVTCEGERCVDTLIRYGFTATTSAGGAKNAKNTDWTPLAGKAVSLWPDNDADGRRYMADVESILQGLHPAPRLSLIEPSSLDLAEREDVVDFVEQFHVVGKNDAEITTAIAEALKTAKTLSIAGEVRQRIADIRAGRYAAIGWPWELLGNLTKALLPGTVTLLAGSVGASKSFMAIQTFTYWLGLNLKVALFEAEEDRTFHLTRALAQRAACATLTDPDWTKEHADEADQIAQEHAAFLDSFGRVIHAMPEAQPNLEQLASWVKTKAEAGCRIIGIDPVTAAARIGDPWTADGRFLQAIKRTATDYGCSILLVTHPTKTAAFADLTALAGAACYQRFAQTILWLEHHEAKVSRVKTACGTLDLEHNKTLYILKARNGKGGGFKLAYDFDAESLSLHEVGLIMGKRKD